MTKASSKVLFTRVSDFGIGHPAVEIRHRDGRIQKGVLDKVTASRDGITLHLINQTMRSEKSVGPILDGGVVFRTDKIESVSTSSSEDLEHIAIHLDDEHGFAIHITKRTRARSA